MAIRIFVTGGTFDKEYNELNGTLFFKETHVPEMLKLGRCETSFEVRTIMMRDSLKMTETDRNLILENCKEEKEDKIIITHGTDTMVETAKFLQSRIKDKTIVLTGAMIPYRFGSSDGLFNLGVAVGFVKALPHGVYIAMNGHCFKPDNVVKNRSIGKFEKIHP
ncbi:Uncharacterised protein [Candidatus Anstonella stagnisolia]|nr:Uncharacterised protein [Candidatus Anstonella stagnisolia]